MSEGDVAKRIANTLKLTVEDAVKETSGIIYIPL